MSFGQTVGDLLSKKSEGTTARVEFEFSTRKIRAKMFYCPDYTQQFSLDIIVSGVLEAKAIGRSRPITPCDKTAPIA